MNSFLIKGAFESSVVLDGTKTKDRPDIHGRKFESSVVLDGTKTNQRSI